MQKRTLKLIANLLLALLVFSGMSGKAISAAFCPMLKATLPAPQAAPKPEHKCCAEKAAKTAAPKKTKDGCCCKLDTVKGAPSNPPASEISVPWALSALTVEFDVLSSGIIRDEPFRFYSGVSPPLVGPDSVRGRAPPVA